jgi:hypothetical protein
MNGWAIVIPWRNPVAVAAASVRRNNGGVKINLEMADGSWKKRPKAEGGNAEIGNLCPSGSIRGLISLPRPAKGWPVELSHFQAGSGAACHFRHFPAKVLNGRRFLRNRAGKVR